MHGDTRVLVFEQRARKLVAQRLERARPVRETCAAASRSGCAGATAADLDLHPVQAGEIDAIGQLRARAQVVEAAAADDAERDAGLRGDAAQQLPSLGGQLRRGGIGMELGERAVEVEQEHEGAVGGPARDRPPALHLAPDLLWRENDSRREFPVRIEAELDRAHRVDAVSP